MLEKCSLCKSSETIGDMKLGSSSDSSENSYSSSEENSVTVRFYRWQIVEKKITKSEIYVTFKYPAKMLKDDIKTLKEHIYVRQINAFHEIKASLSGNNLMLHVGFTESYKND